MKIYLYNYLCCRKTIGTESGSRCLVEQIITVSDAEILQKTIVFIFLPADCGAHI